MISIDDGDKPKAQERFINNLKINEDNKNAVIEKIVHLLDKSNIKTTSADIEPHLADFLSGKDITIKFDVDSFKKINISTKRMFYLLGECGNESLGVQIEGITINTFIPNEVEYTASGSPEKKYKNGMDLSIKSHSIASKVLTQEKKVSLKYHQSIKEKLKTPPPPPHTEVDPIPPTPPPPPHTDVDPIISSNSVL